MTDTAGLDELGRLIAELPAARLEQVFTHASWADDRAESYERPRVPRRQRARARDRASGVRPLRRRLGRAAREDPSPRRLPPELRGRGQGARPRNVSRVRRRGAGRAPADLAQPERPRRVLEAAIAAVLSSTASSGSSPAIVGAFSEKIEYARSSHVDYKTELQEALARSGRREPTRCSRSRACRTIGSSSALRTSPAAARRAGSTKKAAEQEAARQALEALGVVPDRI